MIYDGDSVMLGPSEGAWVPVKAVRPAHHRPPPVEVVLPAEECELEAAQGIWEATQNEGMLFVCNLDVLEQPLDPGVRLAELHPAVVQTRVCQECGSIDTDSFPVGPKTKRCDSCDAPLVPGPSACRQCSAGDKACRVLSYQGCLKCRPEARFRNNISKGPAAGFLINAMIACLCMVSPTDPSPTAGSSSETWSASKDVHLIPAGAVTPNPMAGWTRNDTDLYWNRCYHIVEDAAAIEKMVDCEVPTEEYYDALAADMLSLIHI